LPYAAAATEEEVELHIPRHFSSNGSVSLSPIGASTSCRVQQRRLDQLIEGPLDFLKIDAEGADYDALEGAANLLNAGGSAVLLEHYAPFYAFPEERLGKWIDEGFALHYINDRGDSTPTTLQYLARERERFWHVWLSRANA
jgi:hypothetical protein